MNITLLQASLMPKKIFLTGKVDAKKAWPSQFFQPSSLGWHCLVTTSPSNSKFLGALRGEIITLILLLNLQNRQCEQGHYLMHNAHAWIRKRNELEVQQQKVNGQLHCGMKIECTFRNDVILQCNWPLTFWYWTSSSFLFLHGPRMCIVHNMAVRVVEFSNKG